MAKLKKYFQRGITEAGCDEAGRGCLAGPVVAAAVVLPPRFSHPLLNDSKQMNHYQRLEVAEVIRKKALDYAIGVVSNEEIDEINILQASFKAMHLALDQLQMKPELVLVDGNRFKPWCETDFRCIIKGDGIYTSIAAASILAKTHRDELMANLHQVYPVYGWNTNKGYPTEFHRVSIKKHGTTPLHRMSFNLLGEQGEQLEFSFLEKE